jgi:purine nucleoside phosphorylase
VAEAEIAVIGISGYSSPFDEAEHIELETPYGSPSAPVSLAEIDGKSVAFVGWDTVNMITYPECHLARELELCYANVSIVTDYDVGIEGAGAVSAFSVARVLEEKRERLRSLLHAAIPRIGPRPDDVCSSALGRTHARF